MLIMPPEVLVPIYTGLATPTEGSFICAIYAFILGTFVYRGLKLPQIWSALCETVRITAMIFFIIMAAFLLNMTLTYIRLPFTLSEGLLSAGFSAGIFMLVIILVYFFITHNIGEPS